MKVIIAGSRGIDNINSIQEAVVISNFNINEVVSGTARGVDKLGEYWAEQHGIRVKQFPANWNEFGKSSGYRRNVEMAEYADALLAIWDGKSKGTKHMIDIAAKKGLKVFVHEPS